jgi:transketolase
MENKTQRQIYGETLVKLGKENKDIVALEADLGKSTMSCLFEQAYPERYFQMGIAEQNMMSTAAGLALTGKIPFVSTFAVFASGRAYDQFRQTISIAKLNVKVCGSSSGLSDFGDGSTHQAVEDLALMRAIPNVTVLAPVDAVETEKMIKAMVQVKGPMYLRVNRNVMPDITDPNEPYHIGKMSTVRQGKDVVVFAHGIMVSRSLEAAKSLENKGVDVKVVNVSTLKPLDREAIIAHAKGMKAVVVAEEHSVIGGLCSAVADALRSELVPIEFVGIQDSFGTSAHNYEELLEKYNLTSSAVQVAIEKMIAGK